MGIKIKGELMHLNKYKQRFISFTAAVVMIISALPSYHVFAEIQQSQTPVGELNNREQVYTLPKDAAWDNYGEMVSVNGMSVTNTDNNNRSVKYDFWGNVSNPCTGENKLEIEFTLSMTSVENDSTFSIVGADDGSSSSDNEKAVIRLVHDKSGKNLIIGEDENKILASSEDNTVSANLHAVIDFYTKTYDITAYLSDGTANTYTGVPFHDTSMTTLTGVYSRLTKKGGSVTLSDFTIYKEGESGEPTQEPIETDSPSVTDIPGNTNILYDLDNDTRENKGWTASNSKASYENGALTLSSVSQSGERTQEVSFTQSADADDLLQIDITLTMQADNDGRAGTSVGLYNYFELTDSNNTPILSLKLGNDGKGETGARLYVNDDDTGISSSDGSVTVKVMAVVDHQYNTLYVTLMQGTKAVYSANLPLPAGNISKAVSILHRSSGGGDNAVSPLPETKVDELIVQRVTSPKAFVAGTGGSIGDDGTVNFNIDVGETVSVALLRNYNDTVSISTSDATATVNPGTSIQNSVAAAYYVPLYDAVTVHGSAVGTLGPFSITITDGDNAVERTFMINVNDATPDAMPDTTPLTTIEPQELFTIDFDENNSLYRDFDEYGTTIADHGLTSIEDTSSGLIYDYNNDSPVVTDNPSHSGISGNAFYSFLNTDKVNIPDETGHNVAGNGYRGSKLLLDNEYIQRTDKIKVSYDFAIYNVVNRDSQSDVGMPTSISMTSEAVGEASIPFDFNENHFDEIDANPSDTESVSKHLLTLFTGRPKRDTTNGVHWVDMTNKLAYFDPLYATESNPYGQYRDLGFELTENAYNYFHVDAEVDFYNDVISFTIKKNDGTSEPETATVTTVIPKHASWNGFIIASNKWDEGDATDINGKDTEHYAYLDNISAVKIAEDDFYTDPTSAPTARPLPADAISFRDISDSAQPGKSQNIDDTWAHYESYTDMHKPGETGYVTYDSETESKEFTYNIATLESDTGITSYTEFDFYLPKRGSYMTLHLIGTKNKEDIPGNTITISTAGINSWTNLENYTKIYSGELECGKWYSAQLVYDMHDTDIQVIVKDGDKEIANAVVNARNLYDSYYRKICFNQAEIATVGNEQEDLPNKQPSMAETYIANLRIYNRAVVTEYYPEGVTAVTEQIAEYGLGDALDNGTTANTQRLASVVTDFVRDQVGDGVSAASRTVGALPVPPKNSEGKTFTGWKLIYSNGEGASYTEGSESPGEAATRLKYAAVYDYLTSDSTESDKSSGYYYKVFSTNLDIMDPNFSTIDWYVYDNQGFRMLGRFDLSTIHTQLSGSGKYAIGYVVYNIPKSETITAIPQAHHEPMSDGEKAEPTATPHPEGATEPGPLATSMPQPSGAPAQPSTQTQ